MKNFLILAAYMYGGSVASSATLLALAGLWEKGESFWHALPAAFVLQLTFGFPWFTGALLGAYLYTRR